MKFWSRLMLGAVLACGFAAAAQAQVTATGVSVSPGSAAPGDTVSISVTAQNSATTNFAGTADVSVVFTNLVTGASFTINQSGVAPVGGFIAAATVDPTTNQSTPGTGTFKVTGIVPTQTTQAGGYRATVTMTPSGQTASTITVATGVLTVTGLPDLAITSLTYPAGTSYKGGDVIPMRLTYTNLVSTGTSYNVPWMPTAGLNKGFFRIQIVLSNNPVYGDADDFLLTFIDVSTVTNADGTDHALTWNQVLPGNYSGSYYVLAKIDALNSFDETGEAAAAPLETNVWLDRLATKVTLQPTNFPTLYVASMAGGATAGGYSDSPAISADGRYTAFVSDAANLVTGDTNNARDVFIYDNQTAVVRRLSVSQQGAQANRGSNDPAISGDGRYVAFDSEATNLVFDDTNGFSDVFVVDTLTGAITRESLSSGGVQANGASFRPSISADGRYVVFESTATNLVAGGTAAGVTQIYRRDRTTGTTTLVSSSSTGTAGNGNSLQAVISADANYVAFASDATNLVSSDANGARDIFLRNIAAGTTTLISVATGGAQGDGASRSPSISQDGRYVAFASDATNLVLGDTNGVTDVFVYDRVNATTTRVSVSSAGAQAIDPTPSTLVGSQLGSFNPSISASGRYVVFASMANNLAPGDAVGRYNPTGSGNSALNIYLADRDVAATGTFDAPGNIATTNVSLNRFGYQSYFVLNVQSTAAADVHAVVSGDGRWVAYPSDAEGAPGLIHGATNLLSPDANSARDIIVYDRRINTLPNAATLPTVTISSPTSGSTFPVNAAIDLVANATPQVGTIASVQFFANGTSIGAPDTTFPYATSWTPSAVGNYVLSALVTDSFGNQSVSNNVNITVATISPKLPTVSITSPTPTSPLYVGSPLTVIATASDPDGTVASVQFFANGQSLGTDKTSPFSVTFTPTATGDYTLTAVATDDGGNQKTSDPVKVHVDNPAPPTVDVTSPANGTGLTVNSTQTLHANAASANGTVASVQFFANGAPIGSPITTAPFDAQWTPTTAGTYQITAVVTDNIGTQVTSAPVTVAVAATGGGADTVFTGSYQGVGESGRFAFINARGKLGTLIAYSTSPVGRTYYVPNVSVETGGLFTVTDSSGRVTLSGAASATGVTGTFDNNRLTFIGPITISGATSVVAPGYYAGSLATSPGGAFAAVVGADGSVTIYATDGGSFRDAGSGVLTATGTFVVTTPSGNRFSGAIDPKTGFLSATLAGGPGGTITAALSSGTSLSDGYLHNLSTRGQVGTGANILIAGFVIGGNTSKHVLIRAIGPTLSSFGVGGALADPQLDVFKGSTKVASNDNWGGSATLANSMAQAGAFALPASSLDSVIDTTLAPGSYTAQVSGVGGRTGLALVELYDLDALLPFSSQKLVNIATRGAVGTGQSQLIAGFVVTGNTSKKVLIRAVGPGLAGVSGTLSDPYLRLYRTSGGATTVVRENDNWENGNDPAQVNDAATRAGAFALATGSKDAAILISLPPGVYSAEATGVNSTTGVALIEVYEVP